MKVVTRGKYVRGTLFEIPPNHARGKPLKLQDFKIEVVVPHVYEIFTRVWGMFPHHDEVALYFSTHIYTEFVLHMHPDYTITPSFFMV
jgi:hypothetical protein